MILVLAGETATGKTATAIAIAKRCNGELIGADSVQVYRGFDIGSAKPTSEELDGITHHLIDVRDPNEPLDAMQYAALADRAIEDVASRGKLPIVVGGTGLWLRALLRGLVELPPVDPDVRAELEREADANGARALHERLATIDPKAAAAIHPNDRLRIVRALEVQMQTGEPLGELRERHALGAPRHDAITLVLTIERDALERRIAARADAMIERGFEAEVRGLLERYPRARALGAVGYREMAAYVRGEIPTLTATASAIARSTRIYARRQRTWFASDPSVDHRVNVDADTVGWITERLAARAV